MNKLTAKLPRYYRLVILYTLTFSLVSIAIASQISEGKTPAFGSPILLLDVQDQFDSPPSSILRLSPRGNYVFAQVEPFSFDEFASIEVGNPRQYLWDLGQISTDESVLVPVPIKTLSLDVVRADPAFAFSPDEQHLAFLADNELLIMSIPELEIIHSIPLPDRDTYSRNLPSGPLQTLAWSQDGNTIAFLADSEVFAWEMPTNSLHQYSLGYAPNFGRITHMAFGWVIRPLTSVDNITICDWELSRCNTYDTPMLGGFIISQDGSVMLTHRVGYPESINTWIRQQDGKYAQVSVTEISSDVNLTPGDLSQDGEYMLTFGNRWNVRELGTLDSVNQFDAFDAMWLPDNNYIVALDWKSLPDRLTLTIYEVGVREPINTLELLDVPSLDIRDDPGFFLEWLDIESINQDGTRVLINLGYASLIIPITYN